MLRSASSKLLVRQVNKLIRQSAQPLSFKYSTKPNPHIHMQRNIQLVDLSNDRIDYRLISEFQHQNAKTVVPRQIGDNVPRKDKIALLVNTLMDLDDSREAVYSTLDAWVAWERNFPVASLKNVLIALEKEQQWHRIIQVIKWMLSKGQGTTRGTYGQLIQALDMDHRAEEANEIWKKKLAFDLHSVPWKLCKLMISVYYRNHRIEELVKLFKGLESFDRKPPEKSIVQKVADACEMLGLPEEKERILEKYADLFVTTGDGKQKKFSRLRTQKKSKSEQKG